MKRIFRTGKRALAMLLAALLMTVSMFAAVTAEGPDPSELTVTFVNEYATESINGYTDLTNYKTATMDTQSVSPGDSVTAYHGETPTRRKDAAYGAYTFAGWVDQNGDAVAFPFVVTEDTTLFASFTGVEVTCEVDFRCDGVYIDSNGDLQPEVIEVEVLDERGRPKEDADGNIITKKVLNENARVKISVPYGGSVEDAVPAKEPTRAPQEHYDFVFDGWDYDYTHIYKDGSINAVFKMQGKTYTFAFYDYDNSFFGTRAFVYGTSGEAPDVERREFSDDEFNYSFHDEWSTAIDGMQSGEGEFISMDNITFQNTQPDKKGIIKLYAQYWKQLKEYYFTVQVIDSDGEYAPDVHVQVEGAEKQLLTTFTDESLGQNGGVGVTDETGMVHLSVPYQKSYTISAYDSYYNLAVQRTFTLEDIQGQGYMTLQLGEPYALNKGQQYCNDVCHSFIGNYWITGLNLFYRLFKVKYVCCYDMYAAHGDRLVYASNSSGMTIDRS